MQPCLSDSTIPRAVQLKTIILYCRRHARFFLHSSPPRKFSECAARFLIHPGRMKKVRLSSQFNSFFILCIFTAKPFSLLVRGYIEVKVNKHEIWQALTQLTSRYLKCIKGIFNSNIIWYSYSLIPRQSFQGKRAKLLEKFFFLL